MDLGKRLSAHFGKIAKVRHDQSRLAEKHHPGPSHLLGRSLLRHHPTGRRSGTASDTYDTVLC
jgi:hypothetical protein